MSAKAYMQFRRIRRQSVEERRQGIMVHEAKPFRIRKGITLAIGIFGGLVVGMTSVGSGSLIIVALMVVYPMLTTRELVGTDLVQAIPLVTAAALGHILFGDFVFAITGSILVGSIPGVYIGAKVSSRAAGRAPTPRVIRPSACGPTPTTWASRASRGPGASKGSTPT